MSCDDSEFDDYESLNNWNVERLRFLANNVKLTRPRTLAWCFLLEIFIENEPNFLYRLSEYRKYYNELRSKYDKDPRLLKDAQDDPLSQKEESVWNQHFCDNELKSLILKDVTRTFPDEPYFRQTQVQDLMVRVLFTWSRSHSDIGYRQGMHEILAQIIYELNNDRKYAPSSLSIFCKEYLKEEYLEHDSFMIFEVVMEGLTKFYLTGDVPTSTGWISTSHEINGTNEVLQYLEELRHEHLLRLDRELTEYLDKWNIPLELFGIRWLRLLFGREFPREEISNLWSYLFANGRELPNIHFVVVAMLVLMRNRLLRPDPGIVLSILMKPVNLNVGHVIALAQHFANPLQIDRPPTPSPVPQEDDDENFSSSILFVSNEIQHPERVEVGRYYGGEDVAGELATLALLRAHLPLAAQRLRNALPRQLPDTLKDAWSQIELLTSLVQCRNSLLNVETALEAAENHVSGKQERVRNAISKKSQSKNNVNGEKEPVIKEVQMTIFKESVNYDR